MHKYKSIAVYGGGSFGTALACQVVRCYGKATLFVRSTELVAEILSSSTNNKYLGDIILPNGITPSCELSSLLSHEVIIIAVPASSFTNIIHQLKEMGLPTGTVLLIATKGFADNPAELLSSRVRNILPYNPIAFIAGPNFAKDIARNLPAAATVASSDINVAIKLAKSLSNKQFIVNTTTDIVTIQVAGALKNIIAIKSGIDEATGLGLNSRALLITEALQEIITFSKALGGLPEEMNTALLPGVLGDLVLTCYSRESRNTRFGYDLAKAEDTVALLKNNSYLVEGKEAARIAIHFIKKYNMSLPIIASVAKELGLLK